MDASGRAAVLARLHGVQPQRLDRLVSCFAFCESRNGGAAELMIETVREGWWYTAALPEGRRVIAFMSDSDIMRRLAMGEGDRWVRALCGTEHVRAVAEGAAPLDSLQFYGAGSQLPVTPPEPDEEPVEAEAEPVEAEPETVATTE